MKGTGKSIAVVSLAALMLASCGGGGSGGRGAPPVTVTPTPSPPPTPSASCSLSSRQAFALAVIDEWYLFPNDVANANPSGYGDVETDRKSTPLNPRPECDTTLAVSAWKQKRSD